VIGGLRGIGARSCDGAARDAEGSDEPLCRGRLGVASGFPHEGTDLEVAAEVTQISWSTSSGDLDRTIAGRADGL
jgi:hypothetical protein